MMALYPSIDQSGVSHRRYSQVLSAARADGSQQFHYRENRSGSPHTSGLFSIGRLGRYPAENGFGIKGVLRLHFMAPISLAFLDPVRV